MANLSAAGETVVTLSDAARDLLERYGAEQVGREVPPGWRRRRNRSPHGCYAAAGRWSGKDRVAYTEGMALAVSDVWIPHAWLTDAAGKVIDLAREEPCERYFGIQIPTAVRARVVYKLGQWAPILDALADEGWTPGGGA
jgi:hypothetical protein